MNEQWWLASLGTTLVWARLRVMESGVAEIFDCDGNNLVYDSEDSARAALLDADYFSLDGLDELDARRLGFELDLIHPPQAEEPEALRALMVQQAPRKH